MSSNVQVDAITFTDANGAAAAAPPKLLTSGASTYALVVLKNDLQQLGANWSVYCGSAPPPGTPLPPGQTQDQSCGTFAPVHTISGPIPSYVTSPSGYLTLYTAPTAVPKNGTVTLYASSTTNPSRSTSFTLTIIGQAISVQFAPAPPATLSFGSTARLAAVVTNDTTNSGVSWRVLCASTDCGSFSPATTASGVSTTYTAPAASQQGQVVQLAATSIADPTRSVTATVTVNGSMTGMTGGNDRFLMPGGASTAHSFPAHAARGTESSR